MAAPSRAENAGLAGALFSESCRFDFFQAVRLLLLMELRRPDPGERRGAVGQDHHPAREAVRFRALASLGFPPSAVAELKRSPRPEMVVSFMGLAGPGGALPEHYTRLLIARLREKDSGLRDFLDLFNHRLISLFFRAWEKHRFPAAYERARLEGGGRRDLFTTCLQSLVGMGTAGLAGRLGLPDEALLLYAGFLSDRRRPAVSLERMLSDYFALEARLTPFEGRWLPLGPHDRTRLPSAGEPSGLNCRLGVNAVLGERVWDRQSKFRLRLGPLTYREYCGFLPDGGSIEPLRALTRAHVGPELDFEVQAVLRGEEVPPCRLESPSRLEPGEGRGARLGWTAWLTTRPAAEDFEDAVFSL